MKNVKDTNSKIEVKTIFISILELVCIEITYFSREGITVLV